MNYLAAGIYMVLAAFVGCAIMMLTVLLTGSIWAAITAACICSSVTVLLWNC